MSTRSNSPPLLMTDEEIDMAMLQANFHFQNQHTRLFDDLEDEEDSQQVKPGIGETMMNVLSNAVKHLGQKLAGFFIR
jgi:hypothetical protein